MNKRTLSLLTLSLTLIPLVSCKKMDPIDARDDVIAMFKDKGTYSGGAYTFTKTTSSSNVYTSYNFSYYPEYSSFAASVYASTETKKSELIDFGCVVFSWGKFQRGSFTGRHDFKANVGNYTSEFTFYDLTFKDNISLGNHFEYRIDSNSFQSDDLESQAKTCFECLSRAVGYAQTCLNKNGVKTTLW